MTYLLILVSTVIYFVPKDIKIVEYSSKEVCEAALAEAKTYWKTIDNVSYCISSKDYSERLKKKEELKRLKQELNQ